MRFKSVIGAFFFVLFASFLAFVVFIQTKSFGGLVTRIVSDLSEKKLQTQVKIKSFSISVFPPGLELNRVRVEKEISPEERFQFEFGKIGFYISLIEIEEKKLTFGEIRIADSVIDYKFPKSDKELTEIDQNLIDMVFKQSDNLPVRIDTVLIENSRIIANHELMEAKRLKIFKKGGSFVTRFHLANIRPSAESEFNLDEVLGDAEISKNNIKLYRLKAQYDVHSLLLKGRIENYSKLKGSEASLNGEVQSYVGSLNRELSLPDMVKFKSGQARAGFNLNYKNQDLSGVVDLFLEDFKSSIFYATELKSTLKISDQKVVVDSLSFVNNAEKLTLSEPVIVLDFKTSNYLENPIKARVENVTLTNALRILGPSLKPLRGELSGDLIFKYNKNNLYFTPKDGFLVRDLALVVGEKAKPFTVLKIKEAKLENSIFSVVNQEFQMSSLVKMANSRLDVDGFVNSKRVHFTAPNSQVDLEDFGNISNLDIKGAGELSVVVDGPLSNTVISINGQTKGFEILGYRLDKTEKNISIELAQSEVVIKKMESQFGKTELTGNGTVNYDNSDIALGISTTSTNSSDLSQILHPIFHDLHFLPNDLDFKAQVEVDIFGKTNLDDLKIRSKVNFSDLTVYGENLSAGSLNISLMNRILGFKKFQANKGKGSVQGDFIIGLKDKSLKLDYQWNNLQLSNFHITKRIGLNLNSSVSGSIKGTGTTDDYLLNLLLKGFNTKTPNYKFEDSLAEVVIEEDRVSGKLNFLGNIIVSDFNIALKKGMASDLSLKFKAPEIKPFLVAVFGQHLEAEDFSGRMELEGTTTFKDGFKHLDLTGNLKEFIFRHPEFNVSYTSAKPDFVVRDGVIKTWGLSIKQPDLYITTKGEGVFSKKVSLVHEMHLNSKILEILISPVLSSEGFLRNIVRINGVGTEFDFSVSSKASNLNLSIDQLPIPLNDLKYSIEYANKRLVIQDMSTSLDNGSISLKGDVFFDENEPDVNLKFLMDRAEIPILGKSLINLSGEGIILGNSYPYNVGGEIIVNNAQIVNELNEFSSKSAAFSQIRFLPKNQESVIGKLLNLNLNIKAEKPVRVTNSLMDVALKGEVRVFGNPSRPRAEGRLYTPINSSRIFFKNNEYSISSADINFNPKKEISNPDFDIQALTLISSYKVFPKVYGDLEGFNFDLTSDPPLPRNSILSLIAFGYTDEIQSSLESKDQQNLTQVGVGSFVFDRFKISDILNKQFGLQVNLGTVIEQSGTDSLLSGRSQEGGFGQGGGSLGRTRSATKIELKKRLDEALTLSVSSTMGGSIGQRQSMNLTYGLTRKIQLEGVYELRTNEEGQEDVIDNSIGGDLKFRWTFK